MRPLAAARAAPPLALTLALLLAGAAAATAQSPAAGLTPATLAPEPMAALANPAYLATVTDPAFGTTIRRVSDAAPGERIVPMYSTVQAWNADESLMILYEVGRGHRLHDGQTYAFLGMLPIAPLDIENVFWSHTDPDVLYYPRYDAGLNTTLYVERRVSTGAETTLADLGAAGPACGGGGVRFGNDVQMPSWDDDVIGFRCQSDASYLMRLSTGAVTEVQVAGGELDFIAAMPGPSGTTAFHKSESYDAATGALLHVLNKEDRSEHACIGRWADGADGYFAVAFAQGPQGGCIGQVIGHDLATGDCYDLVAQSLGYPYPRTGTHISALAHRAPDGWLAASMIGDPTGAGLLDQELLLVRAAKTGAEVYRIGHHRSDEQPVDYWGEPHAVISPSGTRVLFGSDWGATAAPAAVNSYVVELPAYGGTTPLPVTLLSLSAKPTPRGAIEAEWRVAGERNLERYALELDRGDGRGFTEVGTVRAGASGGYYRVATEPLPAGRYYLRLRSYERDGRSELSETVSVLVSGAEDAVRLVVDPAAGSLRLVFADGVRPAGILTVTDAVGRAVYRSGRPESPVDASAWPAGLYVVTLGRRSWRYLRR